MLSIIKWVAGATVSTLYRGLVISYLWFMVPLGLQSINYVHAIGISALAGILTVNSLPSKESVERSPLYITAFSLVFSTICLFYGFIAQLFL